MLKAIFILLFALVSLFVVSVMLGGLIKKTNDSAALFLGAPMGWDSIRSNSLMTRHSKPFQIYEQVSRTLFDSK
jgi:hypothetical protein